jgi:Ni,Fe-hydrogenase I large subunit
MTVITKKTATTKAATPKVVEAAAESVSAPAPAAVAVPVTVAEVKTDPEPEVSVTGPIAALNIQATHVLDQLASMRNQIKEMESFVKTAMKEVAKMSKVIAKGGSRKARKQTADGTKVPSGFAKKTKVTDVFVKFLTDPEVVKIIEEIKVVEASNPNSVFAPLDEEGRITRPSATKIINAYVRAKDLQDPNARKNFKPDAKLKKILTPLEEADVKKGGYSFFNSQRYTRHLYVKE